MTNKNREELFRQMDRSVLIIIASLLIAMITLAVMDAPVWILAVLAFVGAVGIYSHERLIRTIHKI